MPEYPESYEVARENHEASKRDGRYPRGFRPTFSPQVAERLRTFNKTNLIARVFQAVIVHGSIAAVAALVAWVGIALSWWLALVAYVPAMVLIARQQRVLELFVHDASHYAWCNWDRHRNDKIANLLSAFPTLSEVAAYRAFHRLHHAYYGNDQLDPCKRRLAMFGGMGLLGYIRNWYGEIGSKGPRLLLSFAAWHGVVYLLPLGLALGAAGPLLWGMFWVVPMLTTLPALRRVAEAEEHDYQRADTEFATTYSNIGHLHKWLIHPAGDAYHLLHHMLPNIPMHRHRQVHRYMMEQVPEYRAGLIRTKVLEQE